jgi:enoyl-[acyl-carrier protein] reductase III
VVYLMCLDEAAWINGSLIRIDGGEHVAGSSS